MKKYNRIIMNIFKKSSKGLLFSLSLSIMASAVLTSCDDFIDVDPEAVIGADSFFSTPEEIVIGVNGVYALQRGLYGDNLWFIKQEVRSDNVGMADRGTDGIFDVLGEEANSNLLITSWSTIYAIINNANRVISAGEALETSTSDDAALVARAVAEAKFLRALTYFHLVVNWGGVPLRTEPTQDFDNTPLARSSASEVYDFIISDLTDAANVLPESYSDAVFEEVGRATSLAANALLGKVHLQNGNSAAASAALNNVIGRAELLPNYSDIFAPGNDNHAESIFEVGFDPAAGTGWGDNDFFITPEIAQFLGVASGGFPGTTDGRPLYFPSIEVQGIYETGDLRLDTSITSFDSAAGTVQYISKYVDLGAADQGSDINWIILRYADVLLLKAEADGESAASYELINQVRRRAFGQNPNTPDPAIDIDATSPGTFFEKVMLERRRELVFEEQRWIDILRHPAAEAVSIINNHLTTEYPDEAITPITTDHLLQLIPAEEIRISDGLVDQNPRPGS